MLESGQDYESIVRVLFKMVSYKRNKKAQKERKNVYEHS
jgi:hypothetical protein